MLTAYSLVDLGSPEYFGHIEGLLVRRGLDKLSTAQICQACKDFRRATNTPKSGKFFDAAEKDLGRRINEGLLREGRIGADGHL